MKLQPYLLHALSPLHAGVGHTVDVIDLPIARMRSTGIPIVPGSSIKGVLRYSRDPRYNPQGRTLEKETLLAVFGPETENAAEHAGALMAGDARLLCMPIRSFRGTFAYATSPLLLSLAARDLEGTKAPAPPKALNERIALIPSESLNLHTLRQGQGQGTQKLYLEDLDLKARPDPAAEEWGKFLASKLIQGAGDQATFAKRFAILDDETMTFLWETATQVDTRIRLNPETRTVAEGALWMEESLPPETILLGVFAAQHSTRKDLKLSPEEVLKKALPSEEILQFGGKATVGRGRSRLLPVSAA